jgi:DNA-binding NarL/FixJ family response regulator
LASGRVIVADSHPTMLAGIRRLLEPVVEAVLMVSDEASLMAALEQFDPDLVIADLSLPIRGETNVARLLKKRYPERRVIILSVHDEPTAVDECLTAGAKGFVLKRTAVNDLIPAVKAALKGHSYVSPSIQTRHENTGRQETNDEEKARRKEVKGRNQGS